MNRVFAVLTSWPQRLMMLGIQGYQYLISPLLPVACRFYPSCSHYSLESYRRFGFLKGTFLSITRLLKCHPFHPGGFDQVPELIPDSSSPPSKKILWTKIPS